MQIVDTGREDLVFEILPRAVADAVACINRRLTGSLLDAQIGAPSFPSGAVTLRQYSRIGQRRWDGVVEELEQVARPARSPSEAARW